MNARALARLWCERDRRQTLRVESRRATFCFVKLDGSQGIDAEGFADKAEMEDALESGLPASGLGAHTGGGTGRRHSYVDLALLDVEKSIPMIRETQ